ncbi:cobalt ECF transporter T component CbiQ [Rhodococcus sp. WAY2]|uniref:cobalt ECF transporter T component CbiQ n=1 Tax=Rhodococcus sp. WAY2 TaxID=2663121 RepID=UPI00131FF319|nr:cobalt ECF transporter T component CbiQ [Rhodococcus sp. WAY2]QHE73947.1 Transmembrane component NikQ of energizing module of nickel ECF transporter [Rhodococcus sp. WAY2]
MGAGHAHTLYLEGNSPVHQLPVEVKIVCAFAFTVAVVTTPRDTFWTFAVYTVVLLLVWRVAQIQLRWILPRMGFELPFVVLAVLLPFTEGGERTTVLGMSVSLFGLQAAWGILVKGTLGLLTALTLAATTHRRDMPLGLSRLRIPGMVTTIVVLMLRYADLLAGEALRMRRARLSRGDNPRTIQQIGATARGVGGLFVRSYERGERVHLAMLSRGFTGKIPDLGFPPASRRSWMLGLTPAVAAVAVSYVAHLGVLR